MNQPRQMIFISIIALTVLVVAGILVLSLPSQPAGRSTTLVAAQEQTQTPVANVTPTATPTRTPVPVTRLCDPCAVYGAKFDFDEQGIWEVNVCTGAATWVQPLTTAYNLGVKDLTHLYVKTNPANNLYVDDLMTLSPPVAAGAGVLSAAGMSEGGWHSLFEVGPPPLDSELWSLIPQPPALLGAGYIGGSPIHYPGDIALNPETCRLIGVVTDTRNVAYVVRVNRGDGSVSVLAGTSEQPVGLAYDGQGRLWVDVNNGQGLQQLDELTGQLVGPTVALPPGVKFIDLSDHPCNVCAPSIVHDLGDAPDSTNHFTATMTAYPGVQASFPSVFDPTIGAPVGPKHWLAQEDAWLGADVSGESDADLLPDEEGVTNIEPQPDIADQDGYDDGVVLPMQLPHCQLTTFSFSLTIVGGLKPRYVNAWFDFNRDGDWGDTFQCLDGQGSPQSVEEWAVANHMVMYDAGQYLLVTPLFRAHGPDYPEAAVWIRMSLSDTPAVAPDGSGPNGGYEFGETEDYLLVPTGVDFQYGSP